MLSLAGVTTINQGIDTLKLNFYSNDIQAFNSTFKENREKIALHKKMAQGDKGYSNQKRGSRINLGGFIFSVKPQSASIYLAYLENDDCYVKISNGEFKGSSPHISVDFRSSFLWRLTPFGAYNYVLSFVRYLFGSHIDPKVTISELHYCSDILGIDRFNVSDFHRFQYRLKSFKQHSNADVADDNFTQYASYKEINGFTAGKGNFLFRIYNKTLQIKTDKATSFIKEIWKRNGYDVDFLKQNVYRHEVQYRRKLLKNYFPKDTFNEFIYLIDKNLLASFWRIATEKLSYLPLTDVEVSKIESAKTRHQRYDVIRKAKKDIHNRFNYWDVVKQFFGASENRYLTSINNPKYFDEKYLFSAVKGLVSMLYKCGYSIADLPNIFEKVNDEIYDKNNYDLDKYAKLKMLGSFTYNHTQANYDFGGDSREYSITAHNIQTFEYFRASDYFSTKREVRKFAELELPTLDDYISRSNKILENYFIDRFEYSYEDYLNSCSVSMTKFEDLPLYV